MTMKNCKLLISLCILVFASVSSFVMAQNTATIKQDSATKTIKISDRTGKLALRLNYSAGIFIDQLAVNGLNSLSNSGVYTAVKPSSNVFSSKMSDKSPLIKVSDQKVTVSNIRFGNSPMKITEEWTFTTERNGICWEITRTYSSGGQIDEVAIPVWNFANLSVWKGGILNNGGMVWCKYLNNKHDTYGVHTNGVTFWNPDSGDGLRITSASAEGTFIASKFFHNADDEFSFAQYLTNNELQPRHLLNRFVRGKEDVFSPFNVKKESVKLKIMMNYINYEEQYPAGKLPGIDANAVRELRNTTARYGVVDQNIMGGNGWTTNWKCLHEPFFARIGLFVDDDNYTRNFSSTLDQEQKLAMTREGRVLSRWHNEPGDEMPGTYNPKTGYYETQWGFTIDSQTGYVINTAEQFDLNGDLQWLKRHKQSCEKALDWLIRRDSNKNGLFEMANDSYRDKKCSDWIDVVYASFENAFVNAQMYEALNLWSACELVLGDTLNCNNYIRIAASLRKSFNKDVTDGGFWSPEKKCYIYWRDKDGTPHGDNIVTPVAFQAIAYGICDDPKRIGEILENIENRMAAENLFHWPLCFDSFKKEEVEKANWPFPNYENGDIFPTWGYVGVKSYLKYDKKIALKYIKKLLEQYNKDGLSSQRFNRKTQQGIGSDILAGICTTITALYTDIYGVRPHWNRMGLEPDLLKELNGTEFEYTLRGVKYNISLNEKEYRLQSDQFNISSDHHFGASMNSNRLVFHDCNQEPVSMVITRSSEKPIRLEIKKWKSDEPGWQIFSADNYTFSVYRLLPVHSYRLVINGKTTDSYTSDETGRISFRNHCNNSTTYQLVKN
jgi:hypothetical protein